MKKIAFTAALTLIIFSCGEEKRQNFTTISEDGEIIMSDESIQILEEIEADYYNCKSDDSDKNSCKHFTAEAICRFYEIEDFKKNGEYVPYNEIRNVVSLSGASWYPIGIAGSQVDLDLAQDNANKAKATIAFDPNKTNHVAIILPGSTQKSNAWGLEVPNSASYFIHKHECYFNKGLSYSFSNPEGIILYTKK